MSKTSNLLTLVREMANQNESELAPFTLMVCDELEEAITMACRCEDELHKTLKIVEKWHGAGSRD